MRAAEQDGGEFYDCATGELIVSYRFDVRHDFDMEGAAKARARFVRNHSEFIISEEV